MLEYTENEMCPRDDPGRSFLLSFFCDFFSVAVPLVCPFGSDGAAILNDILSGNGQQQQKEYNGNVNGNDNKMDN